MLREFKGEDHNGYVSNRPQDRHDPDLIRVVETLGKGANGISADIEIVEVPKVFKNTYRITEYDGMESVLYLPNHHAVKWLEEGKIVLDSTE